MGFALFIVMVVVAIVVAVTYKSPKKTENPQQVNQQWVDFIAAYYATAQTPQEKALVLQMLAELRAQGMPETQRVLSADVVASGQPEQAQAELQQSVITQGQAATATQAYAQQPVQVAEAAPEPKQLDNTSILLYFGAFLFVASAGLFVAFGGASGTLRVLTVLTVMLVFYMAGLWLYDNRPRLKAAGATFVGIGIMLAPLVGVAAYAYALKGSVGLVWFSTSVLCLVLYGYALKRLRTPLLEYVFIGTIVSLFESTVAIIQGPVYYYGWMLAAVGIALQAWVIVRKWPNDTTSSSAVSSQVLLPAALVMTLYLTPSYGVTQFGVTALLAAIYYALQSWQAQGENRYVQAVAAHVLLLVGFGAVTYGVTQQFLWVGIVLLAAAALQSVITLLAPVNQVSENAASVGFVAAVIAVLCTWQTPLVAFAALWVLIVTAAVTWVRQQRVDAYQVTSLALIATPFLYAYRVCVPVLQIDVLAGILAVVVLALAVLFYFVRGRFRTESWVIAARELVITAMGAAVITGAFADAWVALVVSSGVAGLSLVLHVFDKSTSWLYASSVFASLPVVFCARDQAMFLAATALATLWHLVMALWYRLEISRWLGTVAWLLLPLAVGYQYDNLNVAEWYTTAYFVACVGLVLARSVALRRLGRLRSVTLAELERRLKSDSLSYVCGYVLAAIASFGAALVVGGYAPAAVAVAMMGVAVLVALRVERKPELLGLLPVIAQLGVWGVYADGHDLELFSMISIGVAALGFLLTLGRSAGASQYIRAVAVATMYVTPVLNVAADSLVAPVALLIAGIATLYSAWGRPQAEREAAGGVIVVAVLAVLAHYGVHNLQIYTHAVALTFGLYAYWRRRLGDLAVSRNYIVAMLAMATVPLVVQLLAGTAGDLYGLWLIGDQVAIMLLGMALHDRFVVRWGLYVAIGSILYQLRHLGWAAVAVLALFLIGLAIYRLQKSEQSKQPPIKQK